MIDPEEIAVWFKVFLEEACLFAPSEKAAPWALSMALIAEQFTDGDDADFVEELV